MLPTATPYSRNALFSGLFPGEIAARFPDWWGEREDETLNAHERELLEAQLRELESQACRCATRRSRPPPTRMSSSASCAARSRPKAFSAFVFNFVDLLTHGRSESAILYEVARDEIALRQLTLQWFQRSALFRVLQGSGAPEGDGAAHERSRLDPLPHAGDGVRQARRDANLRYKFGEDLRAERPEQALLFTNEDAAASCRGAGSARTRCSPTGDSFFVYPTKLREYQSRYRGSFLHGGVTPEECILPRGAAHAE